MKNFSLLVILLFSCNLYASSCFGIQTIDIESSITKKGHILVANRGTQKPIFFVIDEPNKLLYSCALKSCSAKVKIVITKKDNLKLRTYYAKFIEFIKENTPGQNNHFLNCL